MKQVFFHWRLHHLLIFSGWIYLGAGTSIPVSSTQNIKTLLNNQTEPVNQLLNVTTSRTEPSYYSHRSMSFGNKASEVLKKRFSGNDYLIPSAIVNLRSRIKQITNNLRTWDNLRGRNESGTVRKPPEQIYNHASMVPRIDEFADTYSLRLIGPNTVGENSKIFYEANLVMGNNSGLSMSNVKYYWYLHNSELNSTTLLSVQQFSSGTEFSRLQIHFPLNVDSNYCNAQYIIDVLVEMEIEHVHVSEDDTNKTSAVTSEASKFVNSTATCDGRLLSRCCQSGRHAPKVKRQVSDDYEGNGSNEYNENDDTVNNVSSNVDIKSPSNESEHGNDVNHNSTYSDYESVIEESGEYNSNTTDADNYSPSPTSSTVAVDVAYEFDTEQYPSTTPGDLPTETTSTQNPNSDSPDNHEHEHKTLNLTKDDILQSLLASEQLLLVNENYSAIFQLKIHGFAESLCGLINKNGNSEEAKITINGEIVLIKVEQITKKLARLASMDAASTNTSSESTEATRLNVEFGNSLLQHCSEVDEGLSYVCKQLCFATVHIWQDFLSGSHKQNVSAGGTSIDFTKLQGQNDIWETFLVDYTKNSVIDPDSEIEFHRPVVFRISGLNVTKDQAALCARWNRSSLSWNNSGCVQSKLLSENVLECHCQRFGYFKVQYVTENGTSIHAERSQGGVSGASTRKPNVTSSLKFILSFRINSSYEEVVANNKKQFINSTTRQLVEILKLNNSKIEASKLQVFNAGNSQNGTIVLKFMLSLKKPSQQHSDSEGELKEAAMYFKDLVFNNSLSLLDLEGNPLPIPSQNVKFNSELEDNFDETAALQHFSIASGIIVGIILSIFVLFVGIIALRKYKRVRENSVRRVKGLQTSLGPLPPFRNSILTTHPTGSRRESSTSNMARGGVVSSRRASAISPKNFRHMNSEERRHYLDNNNQSSFAIDNDISTVDVNPNVMPGYTFKSFPNSTIHN